jgi:hypothetical protein
MVLTDIQDKTGVTTIQSISGCSNIIVFANGFARPATELEVAFWQLLTGK